MRIEIKERTLNDNIESITYSVADKLFIILNKDLAGEKKFCIVVVDLIKFFYPKEKNINISEKSLVCHIDRKTNIKYFFKEGFSLKVKILHK